MANIHRWIYFAFQKGRVEVRVEPGDLERVEALKNAIPEEDRFYMRDKRIWCINPRWCAELVELLKAYCPNYPIILEEENADLLITLLEGPSVLTRPTVAKPQGRAYGTIEALGSREE